MPSTKIDRATIERADAINQKVLKGLKEGNSIDFLAARTFVVMDKAKHDKDVVKAIEGLNPAKGTITIEKGKALKGPGSLTCSGMTANRSEFEDAVERISKKKVVWT